MKYLIENERFIFGSKADDLLAIYPYLVFVGFLVVIAFITDRLGRKHLKEDRLDKRLISERQEYQEYLDQHKKGTDHFRSGLH